MKCTTVMQTPNQHYLLLDELYLSSHLGEPRPSGSLCCDDTHILSKPNQHIYDYVGFIIASVLFQCRLYTCACNYPRAQHGGNKRTYVCMYR